MSLLSYLQQKGSENYKGRNDMTAILVHIGCAGPYINSTLPPAHLEHCIDQYQLFNSGDLFILTDRENMQHLPKREGVKTFAIEDYHSSKIDRFVSLYNFGPREFWTVTFTRLMYIENFMRAEGTTKVCEFANDVLIYFDISKCIFDKLYSGLAVTPCGPQHVLDGFMYISEWQALSHMTQFFIDTLDKLGINGIIKKYGYDMVNEMTMMHLYSQEVGIDWLPILPYGEHSTNFEHFNSVFDPATYGQFVGGTRTAGPGIKPQNHYIGVELGKHPECVVEWRTQFDSGLRIPFLHCDEAAVKINNLHIHSKNMKPYMSREMK